MFGGSVRDVSKALVCARFVIASGDFLCESGERGYHRVVTYHHVSRVE
jgi:hypothetical protein